MMDVFDQLTSELKAIFKEAFQVDLDPQKIVFQKTRKEFDGDFTLVVFPFVKDAKMAPPVLAEKLGEALVERSSLVHSFQVVKGFLNLCLSESYWKSFYVNDVDNENYGSGNKTLHNVTAGIGVLEGFSGDLRTGLPWQAIHDGEKFQHEPLRLNVIIEAPIDAMNNILEKHPTVKALCDNGWVQLLAMDEFGKVSHHYIGDFSWEKTEKMAA